MKKVRSRNFILIVCGVLLMILIAFIFTKVLINIMDNASDSEREKEILSNVISSSSKIKLSGGGNFVGSTPKVYETSISNFKVMLSNRDDAVKYSIKFCNMNDENIVFDRLLEGGFTCSDELGISKSCDDVEVLGYVSNSNGKLNPGDEIFANSCVELVVDVSFKGLDSSGTIVSIDKYFLELKMK